MKKGLGRLTVVLVLVLGGCSMHFHGDAKSGSNSSETSGDERSDKDKPKDKDKKDKDKADDKKDDDKKDDGKKDDDKKDDGKKDDGKKDDGKKDDGKKDDDKKDDGKKDDDKKDDDKKPPFPRPVVDVKDTVHETGGGSGGATSGGGSTGGSTGGTTGGAGGSNPIRIKPDKGTIHGSRGEPVNPPDDESGTTSDVPKDGKGKPDKTDSKGERGSGFEMRPIPSVPGLAPIRKPVAVAGFDCKLSNPMVKKAGSLIIKGRGFDDKTSVLVSGVAIEVRSRTATKLVAKIPKDLENGGEVTLKQGNLVASCGKIEISK